uniref:Uncharacterized protein n=1 Tax=Magallana gigas TaxID=29159 RepID=A0A8W8LVY0_MAGGI
MIPGEIGGIGEVVGVVTNTSTLVGVSQDGMSQLCSHDDGVTWNSCLGVEVSEITSGANYVTSTPQPFDDFSGTPDDTMFSTYGFSHPKFDVTGVMNGIKVRTLASGSWNLAAWWGTSDWSLL